MLGFFAGSPNSCARKRPASIIRVSKRPVGIFASQFSVLWELDRRRGLNKIGHTVVSFAAKAQHLFQHGRDAHQQKILQDQGKIFGMKKKFIRDHRKCNPAILVTVVAFGPLDPRGA